MILMLFILGWLAFFCVIAFALLVWRGERLIGMKPYERNRLR